MKANYYFKKVFAMVLAIAVVFTFMPMVTLTANAASKAPLVTKSVDDNGTTTKYSYNKKGLVTKAVATRSSSDPSEDWYKKTTSTYKYNKKNKISKETTTEVETTTSYKTDNTTEKVRGASTGTIVETTTYVTTYTYNKKGLATKSVTTRSYTKEGSDVSVGKNLYGYVKLTDGRYKNKSTGEIKTAAEVDKEATTSGSTHTYAKVDAATYTDTYSVYGSTEPPTPVTYKNQTVTTTNFKYKKKNVKSATSTKVSTEETTYSYKDGDATYTNVDTTIKTDSPVVTTYKYKKGRVTKETKNNPNTWTKVNTDAYYYSDNTSWMEKTESDAYGNKTVTDYKNGAPDGQPTVTPGKNLVYPSVDVATYKYDKKGNLKSGKGTKTSTEAKDQYDEAYDNYIHVVFDNGEYVKVPVSTIDRWTTSVKTTVKNGTKRLLTKLGMTKSYTDGYADWNKGSYSMGRTTFKVKSKKVASKAKKNVESQQWMIQNGVFQTVGL